MKKEAFLLKARHGSRDGQIAILAKASFKALSTFGKLRLACNTRPAIAPNSSSLKKLIHTGLLPIFRTPAAE